jgi:hypothetical protein
VPANYLLRQDTLIADAQRLVAPRPAANEIEAEIEAANADQLIRGREGEDAMRWKLTDAGHLWLEENP